MEGLTEREKENIATFSSGMEHFFYCKKTIDQRKNCKETHGAHLQET